MPVLYIIKKKKKRFIVLFLEVDQMTMYVLP